MIGRLILLACLLAGGAALAADVDRAAVERQFQAWLVTEIRPEALKAGISAATYSAALAGVTLDWTLPDLQPPGLPVKPPPVEWQKEFGSPGPYFGEKNLQALAAGARARLATWSKTLTAIRRKSGVGAEIVLAIWGRETGFGAEKLPRSAIRTIATQAFMGRRKEIFRGELIAGLEILEDHDIGPGGLRSSVAGALGQPQFLPTLFLKYATDFDGDGRRDIWNSVPDTLASIAAYLKAEGWNGKRGWGFEVNVPASVACSLEGPDQGKAMADWAKLGIRRADGTPLPADADGPVFLLMPAGRFGPAFIVTENFYVLKQYNYSDLYALFIGHLADRIASDRPFRAAWGNVGGFNRGAVKTMQDRLVAEGYDVGNADGLVGYKTRIAVGLWQAKHGRPATCFPDAGLIKTLR